MKLKSCEVLEKNLADLIIEVSAEEFESAMNDAFKRSRNSISVPGFRKGKAPRKIVERMYGASVFHNEALDIIMPEVLTFAVKESELRIVDFPQLKDVDIKEGDSEVGAEILISVPLYPEVKLGEYKGLTAVKPEVQVPDEEVDIEVESVRQRNARIEAVDRAAILGDIAVIDYEGFVDGEAFEGGKAENYELTLGSNAFIPGFEDGLLGMEAGQERDVNLTFPEGYTDQLSGKQAVFKVKLNELKEKLLPDLDDEFAKDVSEFDTLDEYRADIRERMLSEKQKESDAAFESVLLEQIVQSMEAEIPEALIDKQFETSMKNFAQQMSAYGIEPEVYLRMINTDPEAFSYNMRQQSEKQVSVLLALEKISELEKIEITKEEIDKEYNEISTRYDMELDKVMESIVEEDVTHDLKLRRASAIVVENAIAETEKKPAAKEKKKTEKKPAAETKEDEPAIEEDVKPKPKKTTAAKKTAETKSESSVEETQEPKPKKPAAKKTAKADAGKTNEGDETK